MLIHSIDAMMLTERCEQETASIVGASDICVPRSEMNAVEVQGPVISGRFPGDQILGNVRYLRVCF